MYFTINKSNDDGYFFNIKSDGNHQTLCHSETYNAKVAVEVAIQLIKDGATDAKILDRT